MVVSNEHSYFFKDEIRVGLKTGGFYAFISSLSSGILVSKSAL